MKTLILNGSPRRKGDTKSLIDEIVKGINGEYLIVDAYRSDISPCIDCRCCWKKSGCAVHDGMQEVYDYIQECDNILIASPIYFSELTGKLLDVASRLQTYFCARNFRKEELVSKPKKGAVILVGGGDGNMSKAYDTARTILHHSNCYDVHELVYSHNTNEKPAIQDPQTMTGIKRIIDYFNAK